MIKRIAIPTPVLTSITNNNLFYKMECYQPTGSFKPRGMEVIVKHYMANGKNSFITSSGGNAGYGLAYVCKNLGVNLNVVVPKTTAKIMIDKIKALGANVEIIGEDWNEADEYAQKRALQTETTYIHPFDHPKLWEGYSKIIDECAEQMEKPDKIILSVGGGGLLCGVLNGLERNEWGTIQIVTAETKGAAAFFKSYKAKSLVTLNKIDTIATSISAKRVSEESFKKSLNFNIQPSVVTDNEAVEACTDFFKQYNILVEPACGAALALGKKLSNKYTNEKIVTIVCGGSGFSLEQYLNYYKKTSNSTL